MDTGCSSCFAHFEPNIDAIGEVKVLTSNFAAEYGRNSGYHHQRHHQIRHAEFPWFGLVDAPPRRPGNRANQFFNNQTGQAVIPRYRYNIAGWTLRRAHLHPQAFEYASSKTKLFFFASQEYTRSLLNAANQYRMMPSGS